MIEPADRHRAPAVRQPDNGGAEPRIAEPAECDHVPAAANRACLMLMVRHLVRGGAERLISGILRYLDGQGVRLLIVKTGRTPHGYEEETSWFSAIDVEQVCLPDRAERRLWATVVAELIRERGVTAVAISDSDDGYRLLPSIRAAAPSVWISDMQYNPAAQVANNRRFSHCIDITVAQSLLTANALIAAGGAPERIVFNPGGIDLAAFDPSAEAVARQAFAIAPSAFVVGFLGRFDETKNPLGFLDVARRRPVAGWTYLLGGSGPIEAAVDRAVNDLPPAVDIRKVGVIKDSRSFLGLIDVLVLTSLIEGRSLVVMEAAAMGRPVVAAAVGGVPELVEHGLTGFLCPPGDPEAIATRLDWLAAHAQERSEIGHRARARALRDFDLRIALPRFAAALLGP